VAGEHFVVAGPVGARAATAVTVVEGDAKPVRLELPRHRPPSDTALRTAGAAAGAGWAAALELVQPLGQADRLRIRARLLSCFTLDLPRSLASDEVGQPELDRTAGVLARRLLEAMSPPLPAMSPPLPRVATRPAPGAAGTAGQAAGEVDPAAVPAPRSRPQRRSILRSWWFWTAVAVAVGGSTAAAVVLTRDDDPGVRLRLVR